METNGSTPDDQPVSAVSALAGNPAAQMLKGIYERMNPEQKALLRERLVAHENENPNFASPAAAEAPIELRPVIIGVALTVLFLLLVIGGLFII